MPVENAVPVPSLHELHLIREKLSKAELNQGHLFNGWPASPELYTEEQRQLLTELFLFSRVYSGGVEQYVRNARRLFSGIGDGLDDFVSLGQAPHVYAAPSLFERSEELARLEQTGGELLPKCVFVLVAGGLGERLGYSGIKVSLPVETATRGSYLNHYLSWVRYAAGPEAPFVIMTSEETYGGTVSLLHRTQHGLKNVHLIKQETVFCFTDTAPRLAVKDGKLLRKPHGHGDVHSLLHNAVEQKSGRRLLELWLEQGLEYIVFLQDTNAAATLTVPVSLAISAQYSMAMNFTCIPRQPKEAVGLLCSVQKRASGTAQTMNIEYNKFEEVARRLTAYGGDSAACGSTYSPFPGSVNTLILNFPEYVKVIERSGGRLPEFINPKFIDEAKSSFKPCRVESLMQDVALLFEQNCQPVGATLFSRFTFQPVKNALPDAIQKLKDGLAAYCATTGERDYYETVRLRMMAAGLKLPSHPSCARECNAGSCSTSAGGGGIEDKFDLVVGGVIKAQLFPIIVADVVAMGVTLADIKARLLPSPEHVHISRRSVLIVEGRVQIESLELDGALRLVGPREKDATPLIIRGLRVANAGWTAREIQEGENAIEADAIRGFVFEKHSMMTVDHAKL
ncbi:putative UTP glucose 1 phosphate uridylyltransferase [Trypanosoma vivax]|nr:putative UTP glucose 1 phosphate uridylyltransferase [Trypanosoma vivax]